MAAAAASSNTQLEYLSSNLISDKYFIPMIYSFVKEAGKSASETPIVIKNINNVCYIPIGSKTREPCEKVTDETMSMIYNPDDLCIVGGAALNIYDAMLSTRANFSRRIEPLEDFLQRKTADIDIKWWPRIKSPKGIILTAFSDALTVFVTEFEKSLNAVFKENEDDIYEKIHVKYPDLELTRDSFEINIGIRLIKDRNGNIIKTSKFGNETIIIMFKLGEHDLKICEIAIYDGSNSQQIDIEGRRITSILPMTSDIYYSNPISGDTKPIKPTIKWGDVVYKGSKYKKNNSNNEHIRKNIVHIAVPPLHQYILQQYFTINNLLHDMNRKAFVNYKRIVFIRKLIENFNLNNNTNKRKLVSIGDKRTYNKDTFITYIDNYLNNIMFKNRDKIISLCKYIDEDDIILKELCDKVTSNTSKGGRNKTQKHKTQKRKTRKHRK